MVLPGLDGGLKVQGLAQQNHQEGPPKHSQAASLSLEHMLPVTNGSLTIANLRLKTKLIGIFFKVSRDMSEGEHGRQFIQTLWFIVPG